MLTETIAIVGGGFSGLTVAYHIYSLAQKPTRVLLFEYKNPFGLGEAYSTQNPEHLLNVPAGSMSALHNESDHFLKWIKQNVTAKKYINPHQTLAEQYFPRFIYGLYLQSLVSELQTSARNNVQVEFYRGEVTAIKQTQHKLQVILDDGTDASADKTVLALGNLPPAKLKFPFPGEYLINDSWHEEAIKNIPSDKNVLIVGTGLTMIDVVLSLSTQNHRGLIYAISRRAQLPQVHTFEKKFYKINAQEMPTQLNKLCRFVHTEIAKLQSNNWREVVDAIRPYSQQLWQNFSLAEKQSFLKHLQPYWNSHRHRVAPQVGKTIAALRRSGKLQILRGQISQTDKEGVSVKSSQGKSTLKLSVDYIINCTGPNGNFLKTDNRLIQSLLEQGSISTDIVHLGFNVTNEGRLIDRQGEIQKNIFSLGPPCKGMLWECTAVPEIRLQSLKLAQIITK